LRGSALKHLEKNYREVIENLQMKQKDVCIIAVGKNNNVNSVLGEIRKILGERFFSHLKTGFDIFWVIDFPMFEYSEEENRFVAQHHPFTMPNLEDFEKYKDTDLSKIRAQS
ncbi:MAG: Asp-tRNA(Asn)/Glu-tRNA(Gln) amidotransferase GatCAB subunit C, partial [Pseudothermotoga sp.]